MTEKYKDKFESATSKLMQYTSNSPAIITGIIGVLRDVNVKHHRKLLSFPRWVTSSQRLMMLQVGSVMESNVTVAKDGTWQVRTVNEPTRMVGEKSLYRLRYKGPKPKHIVDSTRSYADVILQLINKMGDFVSDGIWYLSCSPICYQQ